MKKNRMMRLASGLLVAVLATTSMISGTYAKYTTQDSANDSARVAKWGVELQAFGNLYGESYTDEIVADTEDEGAGIRVQSNGATADVVAPGTEKEQGLTFKLNGQPEVDYQATVVVKHQNIFLAKGEYGVMIEAEGITEANFDEFTDDLYTLSSGVYSKADSYTDATYYTLEDAFPEGEFPTTGNYYPVVYALGGETSVTGNIEADTLSAVAEKIGGSVLVANTSGEVGTKTEDVVASKANNMVTTTTFVSAVHDTNTSVADTLKLGHEVLTWNWAFGDVDSVGNTADGTDKADTVLGNLIAGVPGVVVKTAEGYATLEKADDTDLVFASGDADTVYACLNTQFSLDITVTQVD